MITSTLTAIQTCRWQSPLGFLLLEADERGIVRISSPSMDVAGDDHPSGKLRDCMEQLEEYAEGKRRAFDVPVALRGTPFQSAVWEELRRIPYGETVTYAEIARRIGRPAAVRAVGTAVGNNPVPILIPCHRVLPSSGGIGNFAWGKEWKERLLGLEKQFCV